MPDETPTDEATTVATNLKPCPADGCGSILFMDWGIEVLDVLPMPDLRGGSIDKFENFGQARAVKICAKCNTPFMLQAGDLIDLSDHIGSEEIATILYKGRQNVATPPRVMDP